MCTACALSTAGACLCAAVAEQQHGDRAWVRVRVRVRFRVRVRVRVRDRVSVSVRVRVRVRVQHGDRAAVRAVYMEPDDLRRPAVPVEPDLVRV